MDIVYRVVVILSGVLLLIYNLVKIAQKKMDVGIGSSWTIMSMVVIIFGVFFDFTILLRKVTVRNTVLIFLFLAALVTALYVYALRITELKKRNNEVAVWLSILKSKHDEKPADDGAAEITETVTVPVNESEGNGIDA